MKQSFEGMDGMSEHRGALVDGNTALKPKYYEWDTNEKTAPTSANDEAIEFTKPELKLVTRDREEHEGISVAEVDSAEYARALDEFNLEQAKKNEIPLPIDEEIEILGPDDMEEKRIQDIIEKRQPTPKSNAVIGDVNKGSGEGISSNHNSGEGISLTERLRALEKVFVETDDSQMRSGLSREIANARNALQEEVKGKLVEETGRLRELAMETTDKKSEIIQSRKKIAAYEKISEGIENPQKQFEIAIRRLDEKLAGYHEAIQSISESDPERVAILSKIEEANGQLQAYKTLLAKSKASSQKEHHPEDFRETSPKMNPNSAPQRGAKIFVKEIWSKLKSWFS